MLAYRNALIAWPNFAAAAMNLAVLLEAGGHAQEAIAVLDGALQPDEVRIALLNQRGRLLEQNKRLLEAEAGISEKSDDPARPARRDPALGACPAKRVPLGHALR